MLRNLFFLIISLIFAVAPLNAAEVKNENVRQVGNRILFEFDVEGDNNEDADVNLTLTIKDKNYTAGQLHLEGDRGKTKTGKGKKIYWNVLQDFPRGLNTTVHWDLTAGGGKLVKDATTGIEMVYVKGGCYRMGDSSSAHEVCVNDFYIGKYEVTQGQWQAVMGTNPSYFKNCGDNCPVEQVSWNDAQEFIGKLNQRITPLNPPLSKGGGKGGYRLPTEAEWEYAARSGGKREEWAGTSSESDLGDYAWYDKNSGSKTHPVGQKKPNGLGLYDMSGNVWEWVQDWYGDYSSGSQNNPTGPSNGTSRVLRGGSWLDLAVSARSAFRFWFEPVNRYCDLGFRLARTK
jgi:formylglycine-generating enzyme required for sulfatase activity